MLTFDYSAAGPWISHWVNRLTALSIPAWDIEDIEHPWDIEDIEDIEDVEDIEDIEDIEHSWEEYWSVKGLAAQSWNSTVVLDNCAAITNE